MKLCLYVLYTALHVTVGCIISEPENETITRSPGESVLLPCSCTDLQTTPDGIRWDFDNKTGYYVVLTGDLSEEEKKRYSGRVQTFRNSSSGNASILLSNLTEEDQGDYTCEIESNRKGGIRVITLIIKREEAGEGCIISEPENETITRSPGESVLLSCSCTDLQTKPDEIQWSVTNDDKTGYYVLIGDSGEEDKKRYRGRVQTFNDGSPGNVSLLLSNLTEEDQGDYMCYLTNKHGGMRTIKLIFERAQAESGAELFSTVLMIIILLVCVLGTAAVLYWRYTKRRNEPSDSRGEQPGQEQQRNEDVTYSTVVHGNTARAAPRDANTEETTEYASVRVDGDVTYSTVDHGNRARPPPKEINTEENTEYSSIRLDRP